MHIYNQYLALNKYKSKLCKPYGVIIQKRYMGKGSKEMGHVAKILNALHEKPPIQQTVNHTDISDVTHSNKNVSLSTKKAIPLNTETKTELETPMQHSYKIHKMPHTIVEKMEINNPHGIPILSKVAEAITSTLANPKSNKEVSSETIAVKNESELIEKSSTKTLQNSGTFKPYSLTGLNGFPQEWYKPYGCFKVEYKKKFVTLYISILYTLGANEMYTTEALFSNIGKLFQSIVPVLHNVNDYKQFKNVFLNKYMSSLQHLLVSFYKNKTFDIKHFRSFFSNNVDYNMHKKCTILHVIEANVLKETLGPLLTRVSFTALNDDSPLLDEKASILGYDRKVSQEQTDQMHVDWVGTKCISNKDGSTELAVLYKDTKMYSSNAITGRLAIIPEFFYNEKNIEVYFAKTIEGLRQVMKTKNLESQFDCVQLLENLEQKNIAIKKSMKAYEKDLIKNFKNDKNIQELENLMLEYNKILLEAMVNPAIYENINLGLSNDMGRNKFFIDLFNKKEFKTKMETMIDNITEDQMEALHRTKITAANEKIVREVTESLISIFPKEIQQKIRFAIEYANTDTP